MEKPRITWRNFKLWFKDQFRRKRFFYNMFISRNAWGAFSINSHINQHTGQPKITYKHLETALKSAEKMSEKHNYHFIENIMKDAAYIPLQSNIKFFEVLKK